MRVLTSGELAGMRGTFGALLTSSAVIWRRTSVTDPGGGTADTYGAVGTYPCQFTTQAGRGRSAESDLPGPGVIQISQNYIFLFAYDVDLKLVDRIVCDGKTFEIKAVADQSESVNLSTQVLANLIL